MGGWVRTALQRLRGVLGLGIIGATIGFVVGPSCDLLLRLVLIAVQGVPEVPNLWVFLLTRAASASVDWGLLGAFTGFGFGTILVVTDRKRALEDLPLWRMGLLGGIAGALFLCTYFFLRGGLRFPLDPSVILAAVGTASVIGAGMTTLMVALAKKAGRKEAGSVDEGPPILDGEE